MTQLDGRDYRETQQIFTSGFSYLPIDLVAHCSGDITHRNMHSVGQVLSISPDSAQSAGRRASSDPS